MSIFFRHLLFLIIFLGVVSIERTLGLPLISLVLASNYLAPTERVSKTIGILLTGIFVGVSYLIPLWLGILVIAALVFILEHRLTFFHRETLTYFFSILLAAVIIGLASHFPISLNSAIYHFILAVICLFLIRFWFMKKSDKWKVT